MTLNNLLPDIFTQRLKEIVPTEQYPYVLASFSHTRPTSFRVNSLKTSTEDLLKELQQNNITAQPISWYDQAFIIPHKQRNLLTASNAFNQGRLYIQGLPSMLAPLVLAPKPNEEILDLAAAPGGKTCQIACMMHDKGRIAAVEKSKSRFFKLKHNLKTQGVTCADTYLKDGGEVWRACENRFDRVLLDAPCSSEARFKPSKPKTFDYWSEKKIKEMTRKQWRLIYSAFRSLKPGGILVYSTCSFAPEENELIVDRLLKRFKGSADIKKLNLPIDNVQPGLTTWRDKTLNPALDNCVRILPNDLMTGFFMCQILKQTLS